MYEVVIDNTDGTRDIYDGIELTPATCLFFTAMQDTTVKNVKLNEIIDVECNT
jgi:hypothetical protein